jgi:hypothetical protein
MDDTLLNNTSSRKVVFLDTDDVPAMESRVGDLVQNETEAIIVQQVISHRKTPAMEP